MVTASVKKHTKIIAQGLLIIFLLENCHNPNASIQPGPEKGTKLVASHLSNIAHLLQNQTFIAQDGYQVSFKRNQGAELQATIEKKYGSGTTRQILPTIIDTGLQYSQTAIQNPTWQKYHIHIMPHCVYVGQMGLPGGMVKEMDENEKKEEQENKSKQAKTDSEQKIEKVQKFVQVATKNAEVAMGKDIVLVVGNTGAGKSTIINYLLGSKMQKLDNDETGDPFAEPVDSSKHWAKIGNGPESQTLLPNVYNTPYSNVIYCDCPGFNDTRTQEDRLNITIATQLMVNAAKSIKGIVVVIDKKEIEGRAAALRNISLTLGQLLKGGISPNSILFVFNNKDTDARRIEQILKKVELVKKSEESKLEKLATSSQEGFLW